MYSWRGWKCARASSPRPARLCGLLRPLPRLLPFPRPHRLYGGCCRAFARPYRRQIAAVRLGLPPLPEQISAPSQRQRQRADVVGPPESHRPGQRMPLDRARELRGWRGDLAIYSPTDDRSSGNTENLCRIVQRQPEFLHEFGEVESLHGGRFLQESAEGKCAKRRTSGPFPALFLRVRVDVYYVKFQGDRGHQRIRDGGIPNQRRHERANADCSEYPSIPASWASGMRVSLR